MSNPAVEYYCFWRWWKFFEPPLDCSSNFDSSITGSIANSVSLDAFNKSMAYLRKMVCHSSYWFLIVALNISVALMLPSASGLHRTLPGCGEVFFSNLDHDQSVTGSESPITLRIYIIKGADVTACGSGSSFSGISTFRVEFYELTYGLWRFVLGPGMVANCTSDNARTQGIMWGPKGLLMTVRWSNTSRQSRKIRCNVL